MTLFLQQINKSAEILTTTLASGKFKGAKNLLFKTFRTYLSKRAIIMTIADSDLKRLLSRPMLGCFYAFMCDLKIKKKRQ